MKSAKPIKFILALGTVLGTGLSTIAVAAELKKPNSIDFRPIIGNSGSADESFQYGPTVITVPFEYQIGKAEGLQVRSESLLIRFGEKEFRHDWQYFADIDPSKSCWTCVQKPAAAFVVREGGFNRHETAFINRFDQNWIETISTLTNPSRDTLSFELLAESNVGSLRSVCTIDLTEYREALATFEARNGQLPVRVTYSCE